MSYVRDNGLERARRRRERRSLAILVLCALLVLIGILIAVVNMSSSSSSTKACPHGTISTSAPPQSAFVLNVYNGTSTKGVAGSAASALGSHHFHVGVVGNDPYAKKNISGVGEIRFGPDGAAAARKYVATYAPGASMIEDGRDGTSIDLVVGQQMPTIQAAPSSSSTGPVCKP